MIKFKHFLNLKLTWLKNETNILQCIITLLSLFLLTKCFTNLTYGRDTAFQVHRDFYEYRAISYFLIFTILVRKVSLLNLPILGTTLIYIMAAYNYINAVDYGIDWKNATTSKSIAWGLFLIILVDMIRTGRITKLNRNYRFYVGIFLLSFAFALGFAFHISLPLICPFLLFYLTPIDRKQWVWITDCVSVSWYAAFAVMFTKCLIKIPYDAGVLSGKYYGIFFTPGPIGIFCAGAFVCVIYWLVRIKCDKKYAILKWLLCLTATIYPLWAVSMFAARTAEMGIIGVILIAFIFWPTGNSKKCFQRGLLILGMFIVISLIGIAGLSWLKSTDEETINAITSEVLRNRLLLWRDGILRATEGISYYHYFPQDSVWTALDELTSYRLSLPLEALRNSAIIGKGEMQFIFTDGNYYHAHNQYAQWIFSYGWLAGVSLIIWFFTSTAHAAKRFIRKDNTILFLFLWDAFLAFVMLTEVIYWDYPMAFVLLLLQYPLLIQMEEDSNSPQT
ncbi:MAG: hypothetical protein ACI4HQ_08570 [Acetatifactor sp.]